MNCIFFLTNFKKKIMQLKTKLYSKTKKSCVIMIGLSSGAYPGGRPPGGPSEPLILAPWSKVEECRPHPPPRSIWRP